jgi:integrase
MSLQLKNKIWYIFYRDLRGKMNSKSLKTTSREVAEGLHAEFMANLQLARQKAVILREFPLVNAINGKNNTTPEQNFNTSQKRLKLQNMIKCAEKKRALSKDHLSAFNLFLERMRKAKYVYADEITPAIALQYLETYYNKGNGKTYNNIKSALNTIFRCCLIEANLTSSPFDPIINRKVTDIDGRRNLTDEEIERLMAIMPEPLQLMTMLSRWTAQRLETCARMTPSMFDFETKVFVIQPSKTKRFKKFVCCPIFAELEEYIKPILTRCKEPEKSILHQITNGYRNNRKISEYFSEYCEKAQIEHHADNGKAGFHSLRGSAITCFKNRGMTSEELKHVTGHTTDNTEQIYDRSTAIISAAVERINRSHT